MSSGGTEAMRYFLDTEFVEDAERRTIDLISIGIAAEDGRTYYAISLDFDQARADEWVTTNVLSKLPKRPFENSSTAAGIPNVWKSRKQIKQDIIDFIGDDVPEFWGYFADYDWVSFCWLFGKMVDLPDTFPSYCLDIKQLMDSTGVQDVPFEPESEHSALSDATWNRKAFDWLSRRAEALQMAR
jgi:hypothetical protein